MKDDTRKRLNDAKLLAELAAAGLTAGWLALRVVRALA